VKIGNGRKRRVLLAEDARALAFKLSAALEQAGYEVDVVHDGATCLERARSMNPDLVVLDVMMPRLHGMDVIRHFRQDPDTRDLGVIVCTAKSFKTEHDQIAELGAFAILVKPFDPAALVRKVGEYFDARGNGKHDPLEIVRGTCSEAFRPELEAHRGSFTLWGTRGSVPTPGAPFLRHGGQTSCMQVSLGEDVVVFDAGSGIRNLGHALASGPPRRIHLFITHTHWDHIQGFPFFKPAYMPGFEIVIYGAEGFGKDLRSIFSGQLDRDYFPVQMGDMRAQLEFRQLKDNPVTVGPLKIHWEYNTPTTPARRSATRSTSSVGRSPGSLTTNSSTAISARRKTSPATTISLPPTGA
jgi:CheY-like chemotaxis protein